MFCTSSFSQGWYPGGSRSMSMANASTTLEDVWSYYNNPGAMASVKELAVGISYENRFGLKELQTQCLALAIPMKVGVISVGGHHYGYREFRSYKAGLGYSMQLAENISAGVQLNYQGIALNSNYGSKSTLTAEAGVYAKITDKWRVGMSVFNIGRAKLDDYADDRFSTQIRLGTSYKFSEKVLVAIEADKDVENPVRFRMGIDYELLHHFFLRGGFATSRMEGAFGFGYNFGVIQIDIGTAYDQLLGWSPNFSLTYQTKKKTE